MDNGHSYHRACHHWSTRNLDSRFRIFRKNRVKHWIIVNDDPCGIFADHALGQLDVVERFSGVRLVEILDVIRRAMQHELP